MPKLSSCLIALFFCGVGLSQDKFPVPKPTVSGLESTVPRDELVIVKVSSEQVKYLFSTEYEWLVLADDVEKKNISVWPDKTQINFVVGKKPKKVQVLLNVTNKYVVREKDDPKGAIVEFDSKTKLLFFSLKLDNGPSPDPDPSPSPNPLPVVIPDTKFGLTKVAYNSLPKVVDANNRTRGAKALSVSYAGVASSIRAGAIKKFDEALINAKTVNNTALTNASVPFSAWNDWGNDLQAALFKLYQTNKLVDTNDLAAAFDEVSEGLKLLK